MRALQRPPPGVKLVIDAVCIIKGVKPKKVAGEKVVLYYILNKKSFTDVYLHERNFFQVGTKVDDYWEPSKALLQDPAKFLESLFKFDKVICTRARLFKVGLSLCLG